MSRFRERKLDKWMLGYAAGAWVLLQVFGLLASTCAIDPDRRTPAPEILLAAGISGQSTTLQSSFTLWRLACF